MEGKEVLFLKITPKEYRALADRAAPPSRWVRNLLFAFLVGGAICTVGEVLFRNFLKGGLEEPDARSAASIALVALGALFTGLDLYNKLAKHAGAGTIVPITGFANAVVSPAIEYKAEGHILGIGAKMFSIAGPVIVFGVGSSVVYGLILWIFRPAV